MPYVLLAIASIVVLVPALIAPIPPITDYPNHLARLWLLSGGDAVPAIHAIYRVRWDTLTNIGIDLVGATIGRLTSYEVAGRLSVAAAVLLGPLGGALLWRSVHRRWHWWVAALFLLPWGYSLIGGFLNFQIGIGLAMLFAACEPGLRPRSVVVQLVARVVMGGILMLWHPFALIFYAVLLAGLFWGPGLAPDRAFVRRGAIALVSLIGVGVVFLLVTKDLPGTQEHSGVGTMMAELHANLWDIERAPDQKLNRFLISLLSYNLPVDAATGAVLVLPVAIAAVMRRLRMHGGLLLVSAGLLVCFVVCPNYLFGAFWVDSRFAVMLPFVLVVALAPDLPAPTRTLCAACLSILVVGRTALVASVWRARQSDVAAVTRALAAVPVGKALLPVDQRPKRLADAPIGRYAEIGDATFRHLPALGLPWRQLFVPTIFAARGKQPIEVLPPWAAISDPNGGQLANVHLLDRPADPGAPAYTVDWREHFDYVLVLNADLPDAGGPLVVPPELSLVTDQGFARLYKVAPR